jgi:hypothetical protein
MFKVFAVFIVGTVAVMAGPIASSVPCPVGTSIAAYEETGFACSLGGLTFYDFSFDSSKIAGSGNPLSAEDVSVVPFSQDGESGFVFVGPFTVNLGSVIEYNFGFVADPPPPVIRGYSVSLSRGSRRSPGPQGSATLLSVQCQTHLEGTCESVSAVSAFASDADQRLADTVDFTPVPIVQVSQRLLLDGTKGGIVIQSISSSVYTSPAPVPEPGSGWLMAAGTLLAGATRFLRRGR